MTDTAIQTESISMNISDTKPVQKSRGGGRQRKDRSPEELINFVKIRNHRQRILYFKRCAKKYTELVEQYPNDKFYTKKLDYYNSICKEQENVDILSDDNNYLIRLSSGKQLKSLDPQYQMQTIEKNRQKTLDRYYKQRSETLTNLISEGVKSVVSPRDKPPSPSED